MHGPNKMMVRKKMMDSMMKEKPMGEFKKPSPQVEMGSDQEGYESFMVTPEEKDMILSMRKQGSGDHQSSEGDMTGMDS